MVWHMYGAGFAFSEGIAWGRWSYTYNSKDLLFYALIKSDRVIDYERSLPSRCASHGNRCQESMLERAILDSLA